jgi:hypothetical protein
MIASARRCYGALLALNTLTHQLDYDTDFQSYAEYITTERFW